MANKPQADSLEVIQAALSGEGGLSAQLQALLLRKFLKQETEENEALRIASEARKSGARALEQNRQMALKRQNECSHLKKWGGHCVVCQRDHGGHYHFMCLNCRHEWLDDLCPFQLRTDGELIGGPNS